MTASEKDAKKQQKLKEIQKDFTTYSLRFKENRNDNKSKIDTYSTLLLHKEVIKHLDFLKKNYYNQMKHEIDLLTNLGKRYLLQMPK